MDRHHGDAARGVGAGGTRELAEQPSAVVSEDVEPLGIHEGPYTGKPNPHAWMSPTAALIYVDNIRDAFVKFDPDNAETYKANAEAYKKEIEATIAPIRPGANASSAGTRGTSPSTARSSPSCLREIRTRPTTTRSAPSTGATSSASP